MITGILPNKMGFKTATQERHLHFGCITENVSVFGLANLKHGDIFGAKSQKNMSKANMYLRKLQVQSLLRSTISKSEDDIQSNVSCRCFVGIVTS